MPPVAPDVFVLDYFPQAEYDGLKVTWQHGVNSKEALEHAMKSKFVQMSLYRITCGTDQL